MTHALKANDKQSWIDTIWDALQAHRETNIPEGVTEYDEQWDEICTAMAWIAEELGLPTGMDLVELEARVDKICALNGLEHNDWLVLPDGVRLLMINANKRQFDWVDDQTGLVAK